MAIMAVSRARQLGLEGGVDGGRTGAGQGGVKDPPSCQMVGPPSPSLPDVPSTCHPDRYGGRAGLPP